MYNNFDDNNQNNAKKRTSSVNSSLQEIYNQFLPQEEENTSVNNQQVSEEYIVDPRNMQKNSNVKENNSFILDPLESPQGLNITDFEKNFDFKDFSMSKDESIENNQSVQNKASDANNIRSSTNQSLIDDSLFNSQNEFTAPAIKEKLASLNAKIRNISNTQSQGLPSAEINSTIDNPKLDQSLHHVNPFKQRAHENEDIHNQVKESIPVKETANNQNVKNVVNAVTAEPMQSLQVNSFKNMMNDSIKESVETNYNKDPSSAIISNEELVEHQNTMNLDNIEPKNLTKEQKEFILNHEEDPDGIVDDEYIKRRKVKAQLLQEVAKEASLDKTFGKKAEIYSKIQDEREKMENSHNLKDMQEDSVILSHNKREKPELNFSYFLSQFKGAFLEYTALGSFLYKSNIDYKVPYASSMGFIHLIFALIIGLISSFILINTNNQVASISLFILTLFICGLSAFRGLSNIISKMLPPNNISYIAPLVTIAASLLFIYAYQTLEKANSAYELFVTYALSILISSNFAATLAFNGYVDEKSNYSRMSLLGILGISVITIVITFLVLHPMVASSVFGVALFFRTAFDLILQKCDINIDRDKVMACMFLLIIATTFDIAFFGLKFEFLSSITVEAVKALSLPNLFPTFFMPLS